MGGFLLFKHCPEIINGHLLHNASTYILREYNVDCSALGLLVLAYLLQHLRHSNWRLKLKSCTQQQVANSLLHLRCQIASLASSLGNKV